MVQGVTVLSLWFMGLCLRLRLLYLFIKDAVFYVRKLIAPSWIPLLKYYRIGGIIFYGPSGQIT